MFKFIATAVLALSAFSAQSAICYYCTANGAAEHGLMEVQAPGKNCPARGCTGVDEPNGIADHGTIFWRQDLPGKNCPSRGCTGSDEPNGSLAHGLAH